MSERVEWPAEGVFTVKEGLSDRKMQILLKLVAHDGERTPFKTTPLGGSAFGNTATKYFPVTKSCFIC